MSEDDITITAEGAKLMASEKVSTGDYENAQVSTTLEVSVEGADLTETLPDGLRNKLYALQRQVQSQVEAAAEQRKNKGALAAAGEERSHEV